MFVILWEFEAEPHRQREFESAYGPGGSWARLFRKAEGFVATELLRDRETPGRYLTIDRWESQAAFEAFRQRFAAEYEEIDKACESLTRRETLIGRYEIARP